MRKLLLLLFVTIMTTSLAVAQVTTSGLTGTIKDAKGVLPGATIVATHVSSGSVYSTVSRATGQFTIPNMRVGGPYSLKITFVGYNPKVINDLVLNLGEPLRIDVTLDDLSKSLNEVVVVGQKKVRLSALNVTVRQPMFHNVSFKTYLLCQEVFRILRV
ncbi:carboxypeptidase-like regulatory domain-containing protein [Mucilaginibacter sp. SP1R1]|uniref:carboxypeptidase-like regulatory domain-containing protein n=1 Tax=Mucilaginibacter sp. SP1R1 TaxID=2723091 RepID=UPI003B005736